ncbi:MAG: hypothetical protein CL758_06345 [Chloroflexi bacterium]|nr:hypothetical protein [Chloroflexota bacterium]|tara:strand:- start:1127 stop:5041 length:3915 start_codon:yes stop_codon:yes gene_type:complete
MVRRKGKDASVQVKEICIERFQEWWDADELVENIEFVTSPNVFKLLQGDQNGTENLLKNKQRLAELLFDCVGPRFIHTVFSEDERNNKDITKKFWGKIFSSAVKKDIVNEKKLLEVLNFYGEKQKKGNKISKLCPLDSLETGETMTLKTTTGEKIDCDVISNDWRVEITKFERKSGMLKQFTELLKLPISVKEKPRTESIERKTTVKALNKFPPLYDYQFSTGRYLRKFFTGEEPSKRTVVTVPTGAGKTRLAVEAIIEWIADGKPSRNEKLSKSRFVLFIAPTIEICEQAVDSFEEIYKHRGDPTQDLNIYRVWGKGGSLPTEVEVAEFSEEIETGIIVANIQSMTKIKNDDPGLMNELAEHTGIIVVDEVHGITSDEHRSVLKSMGFDWSLKKSKERPNPEFSTKGIVLVGLTATDYRGSGETEDTRLLHRMFSDKFYHPIIQNYEKENLVATPIIDCPKFAPVGEDVRISAANSFHYGGVIEEYHWKIKKNMILGASMFSVDESQRKIRELKNEKDDVTIAQPFNEEGEYEIKLTIKDNFGKSVSETETITIRPKDNEQISSQDKQIILYQNLMKRKILCHAYQDIIKLKEPTGLDDDEQDHLDKWHDFSRKTLNKKRDDFDRNISILNKTVEMMKKYDRKKILIFAIDVLHATILRTALQAKHGIKSELITGSTQTSDRNKILKEFKKLDGDVSVLCNVSVLTQGFDAPIVDCVIVARPTHSNSLYTQMIGRGLRGEKSNGTSDVIFVDIDDQFIIKDIEGKPLKSKHGFELFKEFWYPLIEYGKGRFEPKEEDTEITWKCKECEKICNGWDEIQRIVKPTQPIEHYIDSYLRGKRFLPKECEECRVALGRPKEDKKTIQELNEERRKHNEEQKRLTKQEKTKNLRENYEKYKNTLGHPPTQTLFFSNPFTGDDVTKQIIKEHYGNYNNFVKEQGDTIRGNKELGIKLIDEYCDEFAEHHEIPSKYMMDQFGIYKVQDYIDVFGSYEIVEKKLTKLLEKVANIDKEIPIEKLEAEYIRVKNKIGNIPSLLDFVKIETVIGVEYYLKTFRTFSKAVALFENRESPEFIKKMLKQDYWTIRKKIDHAVSLEQMMNHGHFASKINEIWKNYETFLVWVGEEEKVIKISFTEKDEKRKKFLEEKLADCSKNESKTLETIYNDDEFWYKEYFQSKIVFMTEMNNKKPGILSRYQALIDRKLHPDKVKSNKKSNKKRGPKSNTMTMQDIAKQQNVKLPKGNKPKEQKTKPKEQKKPNPPEYIQGNKLRKNEKLIRRGKMCPKCFSKTERFGKNVQCSNNNCNWYRK